MIVVKLMGGLGNQMFQYALGRRLAYEMGVPLKLDLSWFQDLPNEGSDTVREFALDEWRIDAAQANNADLARFPLTSSLMHRIARRVPAFSRRLINERSFRFDPSVLAAPSTAYLCGYWQSQRYFESIEYLLRSEFTMRSSPCSHAASLRSLADSGETVSVHVRRGDYVHNPQTNAFHGICSVEYYKKAAASLAERLTKPRFLVFTDDPDWARENIHWTWPTTFVEHDQACLPHNDIWLMSQCTHHIIANSSFSWWGAWLGINPQKKVIAPAQWFRQSDINTTDLIPETWIRI